jgi:hypothetical protein
VEGQVAAAVADVGASGEEVQDGHELAPAVGVGGGRGDQVVHVEVVALEGGHCGGRGWAGGVGGSGLGVAKGLSSV